MGDMLLRRRSDHSLSGDESPLKLRSSAHLRVANPERPNADDYRTLAKTGGCLTCGAEALEYRSSLELDLMELASNHIVHNGPIGMQNTPGALEVRGVAHVAAGSSIVTAAQAHTIRSSTGDVCWFNLAENEGASASASPAATRPYGVVERASALRVARRSHNHVPQILHGGLEHWRLSSPPETQGVRFFAGSGASPIVAHHTHITSASERHGGVPNSYGVGNLAASSRLDYAHLYRGLTVSLECEANPVDNVAVQVPKCDGGAARLSCRPLGPSVDVLQEARRLIIPLAAPGYCFVASRGVVENWESSCIGSLNPLNRPESWPLFRPISKPGANDTSHEHRFRQRGSQPHVV
jgi:hypothetical protein